MAASPNLTTITPGTGTITDNNGNLWTITTGGQVAVNGVIDTSTGFVIEMAWVTGLVYQENSGNLWWSKTLPTDQWSPAAGSTVSPLTNLPTITINPIASPTPNVAFTVTGSMLNEASIPTLTFSDNAGAVTAFPGTALVTLITFTFSHPVMPTGNYTLTVSDGTYSGTANYTVATAGWTNLAGTTGLTNTISGLLASTAYDVEVFATNTVGQGPPSAILPVTTAAAAGPVVPGAPTSLAVTAAAPTTMTLSWTAPAVGTPPFVYATQSSLTGANTWTNGPSVSTTAAQITGLTGSTTYDFRISAGNAAGSGPFSALLTASTTTVVTPVTWQPAGATPALVFSNGNLTVTGSGADAAMSCVSTTSITSASGLRQFEATIVTATVDWQVGIANQNFVLATALGLDNNGVAFNPEFAQTVFCGSGAALSGGTTNSPAGEVVTVVFDPAAIQIWVSDATMRSAGFPWNNSPTATPSTLTGGIALSGLLTAGSYFACFNERQAACAATGNFGASAFTVPLSSNVVAWNGNPATIVIPGSVTGLAAGTPLTTSVPLTWTPPTTGTLAFTYSIQRSAHGAGVYTLVGTTQVPSFTVTGLSALTSYDFLVFASNGAGNGGNSAVVNITTAAIVVIPGAPVGLSAGTPTSSAVPLTWQAPSSGSAATSYQVQFKLASAGSYTPFTPTTTATNQTVTGLLASTAYNFQVSATNAAGTGPQSSPAVNATTAVSTAAPTVIVLDAGVQNPPQTFTTAGVTYNISPSCQVVANGTIDGTTSAVTMMVLSGTTISHRGGGAWFAKTSPPATWAAAPDPRPAGLAMRSFDLYRTFGYNCGIDSEDDGGSTTTAARHIFMLKYLNSTLLRFIARGIGFQYNDVLLIQNGVPGLKWNFLAMLAYSSDYDGSGTSSSTIPQFAWSVTAQVGGQIQQTGTASMYSLEGQNEVDLFNGATSAHPNNPQGWQNGNIGMVQQIRSNSALNAVPINNLTWGTNNLGQENVWIANMGNQIQFGINWATWHGYCGAVNIWGGQEGLPAALTEFAIATPGHVGQLTEWGYTTVAGSFGPPQCPGTTGGGMIVNGFMDCYYLGLRGSYPFALTNYTGEGFAFFDTANPPNPVPMAVVVHNFTTIILDGGTTKASFTPASLKYTITTSGSGMTARSILVQCSTSSNTFFHLTWNTDAIQDQNSPPNLLTPAPCNVTLTFGQPITSVAVYDPSIGITPTSTVANPANVIVPVAGWLKIIKIVTS